MPDPGRVTQHWKFGHSETGTFELAVSKLDDHHYVALAFNPDRQGNAAMTLALAGKGRTLGASVGQLSKSLADWLISRVQDLLKQAADMHSELEETKITKPQPLTPEE